MTKGVFEEPPFGDPPTGREGTAGARRRRVGPHAVDYRAQRFTVVPA